MKNERREKTLTTTNDIYNNKAMSNEKFESMKMVEMISEDVFLWVFVGVNFSIKENRLEYERGKSITFPPIDILL